MKHEWIVELLKAEVLPTRGCTEPGAVALAAAYAASALAGGGEILHIEVIVNANVYKNGIAVGIPGTGKTGLHIAAALGAVKRQPEKQLGVLADISPDELRIAQEMVAAGKVVVRIDDEKPALWIKVTVKKASDESEAIIADYHTHIVSVRRNGESLFDCEQEQKAEGRDVREYLKRDDFSIAALVKMIETIDLDQIQFLWDGIVMNLTAARMGIDKRLGMGIGALYSDLTTEAVLADDVVNYAKMLTAAAADARMSGENVDVMSSAGSGNHGITAILPIYAAAEKIGASREKLIRAVALSHLITIYIKVHTGNLSALCGCAVAAATGATAGITWISGGNTKNIEAAMKNLIANLTGMICDGGKVGCALKLSTAAAAAVESSLLACHGIVVPDSNGIIEETIEGTIKNLGKVSNPGMLITDKVILDVILEKQKSFFL